MGRDLHAVVDAESRRYLEELTELLRIPSVSTTPEHRDDVRRAADWLADAMRRIGVEAEVHATEGHPIVLGEWRGAGDDAPTVLIYGHYDVQPAEPLDRWTSPPFEPAVRDGRLYARGATDDKGQLWVHLKALETHLLARGTAPVNFVFVVEGEEETGSGSLVPFLDRHRERLACDLVVISDSTMAAPDLPAIVCSTRGMTYFQVDVIASDRDLHSGEFGGAVVNAAAVLSRLIASLHDDDGRVAVDGFYDAVRDWPELSRGLGALEGFERELRRAAGTARFAGEAGYGTLERLWLRPTCEVNGLLSGFVGDGMKTVIPARASAKLSCRLVVDQDPKEIERRFREHLVSRAPDGVEVEVRLLHGSPAWRADLDPELLAASPLLVGFGLPDENAHAPDELLDLSNFDRGIRAMALLWDRLTRS